MDRKKRIIFVLLGLLFLLLITVNLLKPIPIDWNYDFRASQKKPFGCYVFRNILPITRPGVNLKNNIQSLYNALEDSTLNNTGLLIVTDEFSPGSEDQLSLIKFVERGNKAMIAAQNFGSGLMDSLKVKYDEDVMGNLKKNGNSLNFLNPYLKFDHPVHFKGINNRYFSSFDTSKTTPICQDSSKNTVFIGISMGEGKLYLLLKPEIFSNYDLLYSDHEFMAKTMSYLDTKSIVWDEYYKPNPDNRASSSPLRYILNQDSLRTAYYLVILSCLLFFIFESQRKQRIIPVIKPLSNTSVDYANTLSQLYYNQQDHLDLAHKKIVHFYDFIASNYYLIVDENSEIFRHQFAAKANISLKQAQDIFDTIILIKTKKTLSQKELVHFIKLIDQFQYADKKHS